MATATVTEVRAPGALVPEPFRVSQREPDTADTWTLVLERLEGGGPVIAPGQFMMVYAFGIGEVPISVSGPPNRPGPVVLTVRDIGPVTHAVCSAAPGTVLGLRGPFGNHWPVEEAAGGHVLVVAGGIGLAPLRPVVLHALAHRGDYPSVGVLYGARTPDGVLYPAEHERWRSEGATVEVTVDAADATWRGHVGVVPKLIARASFEPARTTAFVCGPEIMMRFTVEALQAAGVPDERIMLSLERNMRCGVGLCGHCQLGPTLICRDGPIYSQAEISPWLEVAEL